MKTTRPFSPSLARQPETSVSMRHRARLLTDAPIKRHSSCSKDSLLLHDTQGGSLANLAAIFGWLQLRLCTNKSRFGAIQDQCSALRGGQCGLGGSSGVQ